MTDWKARRFPTPADTIRHLPRRQLLEICSHTRLQVSLAAEAHFRIQASGRDTIPALLAGSDHQQGVRLGAMVRLCRLGSGVTIGEPRGLAEPEAMDKAVRAALTEGMIPQARPPSRWGGRFVIE